MDKPRILVIEDDDLQYEIYEEALSDFQLERVHTATAAIEVIRRQPPDLIILDHILDHGELGLEFLPEFKELLPYVPVIVVSGALQVHQQIQSLQGPLRAHYCLTKPLDLDQLLQTIHTALTQCGEAEVVSRFEALERSKRVDADILLSRSADRLSRQNDLLDLVRNTTGRPNVSALARRFRVARRTIIRDLQELIRRGQLASEVFPKWEPEDPQTPDGPEPT